MDKNYICIGKVNKQHGVKGEIKATILLDNPKDISKISAVLVENEGGFRKIERCFALSEISGLKLEGINSCDDAIKIKGKKLYAKREEVDKIKVSEIYIADILNKTAVFIDGEEIGKITDVQNFGSCDVIYINSKNRKNLSFANVGGIIKGLDEFNVYIDKDEFNKVCVSD